MSLVLALLLLAFWLRRRSRMSGRTVVLAQADLDPAIYRQSISTAIASPDVKKDIDLGLKESQNGLKAPSWQESQVAPGHGIETSVNVERRVQKAALVCVP